MWCVCDGVVPPPDIVLWGVALVWGCLTRQGVLPCPLLCSAGSHHVFCAMSDSLCKVLLPCLLSGSVLIVPLSPVCCLGVDLCVCPGGQVLWVLVALFSLSPRVAGSGFLPLFPVASVQSTAVLCSILLWDLVICRSWGRCRGP
jgi:hypothetical protein